MAEQERLMVLLASEYKAGKIESVAPENYHVISVDPHVHEDHCKVQGDAETVSREKAIFKLTTALDDEGRYKIAGRVLEQTGINLFTWPGEVVVAANDVVQGDKEGWVYEKPSELSAWIDSVEHLSDKELSIIGTWAAVPFHDESRLNYLTYSVDLHTKPFTRDEVAERVRTDDTFANQVLKVATGLGLEAAVDMYTGPFNAKMKVNSHGPKIQVDDGAEIQQTMAEHRRRMIFGAYPAMFDMLYGTIWSVDTDAAAKEALEFQLNSEEARFGNDGMQLT